MHSDIQFYQLFATEPRFLDIFIDLDPDTEYTFAARTFKEASFSCDGLLESKDLSQPGIIFEFQMQEDGSVYRRIFQEMVAYHRENPERGVQGVLVFFSRKLNKTPDVWWHPFSNTCTGNFKVLYLDEIYKDLKQSQPDAPLLAILAPFMERDPEAVWANLQTWITQLQQLPLPNTKRIDIINVLLSWAGMILQDSKKKELVKMLRANVDFRDNFVMRAFREDFEVMKEAMKESMRESMKESMEEAFKKDLEVMKEAMKKDFEATVFEKGEAAGFEKGETIGFEKGEVYGKIEQLKDMLERGVITQAFFDAEIKALT